MVLQILTLPLSSCESFFFYKKACVNNQEEQLNSVIINFRDVNSNDKKANGSGFVKVSTAQAFLPKVVFWPSIK